MKSVKTLISSFLVMLSALSLNAQTGKVAEAQGILTEKNSQTLYDKELQADVVVAGGGLAGVCAAVSAARHGCTVILVLSWSFLLYLTACKLSCLTDT